MKSIELFAGAGGLGIGLHRAGFHPVQVVERDIYCCDTIRENQKRTGSVVRDWTLVLLGKVDHIAGAGVYVIYYCGPFDAYGAIRNSGETQLLKPIYVGKAIPKGGRKGGLTSEGAAAKGRALADRLRQHANSVDDCINLELNDFWVRHLVVDDVWIPLGENILIETFKPLWNQAVDGFGNKDPGKRRSNQFKSPWDVLHPGRSFAEKLGESPVTVELVIQRISDHFAGRSLTRLPKLVAAQQAELEVLEDLDEDDVEAG